MGGRGSISAGGKSSKARGNGAELSLKEIDLRMAKLADTMGKTAAGHTGYLHGIPSGSASDHRRYVAAQREYQRLQGERGRAIDKMTKEKQASAKKKQASGSAGKTFVNSFGEATTREITSLAYKRAQRRMKRDVLRNMGY